MNNQQKGLILLIRSSLSGESFSLPADFDLSLAAKTAAEHQISAMLYYGALNCGIDESSPIMAELFNDTCKNMVLSQGQMYAIDTVLSAFEKNGIAHLPLKGVLLKKLYPRHEMRTMSDADILIRFDEYEEKIKPIMLESGFLEGTESDHELHWHSKTLFLELHKRIIPSYNKDYYSYFGDGWRLAKLDGEYKNRYKMSDEDRYIYLFTHLAKHYRNGGIGIKHMTDLWVCTFKNPELDYKYIKAELEKLQLLKFYNNISSTLSVWFGDSPDTEMTDLITDFIFSSGAYGTFENKIAADGARESQTGEQSINSRSFKRILSVIFLPFRYMKEKYPIVGKIPLLLPVFWVVRWFEGVFKKGRTIESMKAELSGMTAKNVKDYNTALKYVGLNFNFEE